MAYVYILESLKTGRYYIGTSNDVGKRLEKHNQGQILATKNFRPYREAFRKEYPSLQTARQIEFKLKRLKRKDYIKKIIKSGKIMFRPTSSSGRALPF